MHWLKFKDGSFINLEQITGYSGGKITLGPDQIKELKDKEDFHKIEEHLNELAKVSESMIRQIKEGKMWM